MMDAEMRTQVLAYFPNVKGAGVLDFVTAWYAKAADMMKKNQKIQAALVSTNSIIQGEQVPILWKYMFEKGVKINFLHQTFKWTNDAKGVAAVYCTIVGFALFDKQEKRIFEYSDIRGEPNEISAKNINGYGIDAPSIFIESRSKPISDVPRIGIGNKPIDGGNYLFSTEERIEFMAKEPKSEKYFKRWLGAYEFLNRTERWCLWIGDTNPSELRSMPLVMQRIEAVKQTRLESRSKPTQDLALRPTRFHVENMP